MIWPCKGPDISLSPVSSLFMSAHFPVPAKYFQFLSSITSTAHTFPARYYSCCTFYAPLHNDFVFRVSDPPDQFSCSSRRVRLPLASVRLSRWGRCTRGKLCLRDNLRGRRAGKMWSNLIAATPPFFHRTINSFQCDFMVPALNQNYRWPSSILLKGFLRRNHPFTLVAFLVSGNSTTLLPQVSRIQNTERIPATE